LTSFDLSELGWSADLAASLPPGLEPARITKAHRGAVEAQTSGDVVRTRLPGRLLHDGVDVGVGDWVGLKDRLIRHVLPRRSAIVRSTAGQTTASQVLAANIDLALLVSSFGPDLNPRRIERYLVTAWESGVAPEIVLTKADRVPDPATASAEIVRVAAGVPVHVVSALSGLGCGELRARIGRGVTAVLLGSSGVGKSTLVNLFAGDDLMPTRETRADDDEGRHTTSHRELILLPGGGVVIDTPGLRELQLWEGASGLGEAFADIGELSAACRFSDCTHGVEPGCAVLAAVDDGSLPLERLRSWRKLQRELAAAAQKHDVLLRKQETRRWQLLTREGRARSRPR
jgi:ribosome biogenesis GTPase